jgi:hypothetical protein
VKDHQEVNMQAAATRLSRWAIVGAAAALLTGLAGTAQARPWHGWWHGHYWGPSYVTVAPSYRPYYYTPYYRPYYYTAPPVAYGYPSYGYPSYGYPSYGSPEPTYTPYAYAAPGASFNFTVPLR